MFPMTCVGPTWGGSKWAEWSVDMAAVTARRRFTGLLRGPAKYTDRRGTRCSRTTVTGEPAASVPTDSPTPTSLDHPTQGRADSTLRRGAAMSGVGFPRPQAPTRRVRFNSGPLHVLGSDDLSARIEQPSATTGEP